MALDKDHFRPMAQVDGPVKIRFVDEDQRQRHEREHGEEAGADEQYPFGPHTAAVIEPVAG